MNLQNKIEYMVSAAEMRRYDRTTSEYFGISAAVLMERAALACAQAIEERQARLLKAMAENGAHPGNRVLIAAGCGNNGGDGFAVGRLLMQAGYRVDFLLAGNEEKASALTKSQIASVRAYGGVVMRKLPDKEYDIIIDALFGVGLSRPVEGGYKEIVDFINGQDAYVLSVDIPSGIHSDTGEVMGCAVCADMTVTFGFQKYGTFFYPGRRYAGNVTVCQIGITQESFLTEKPKLFTFHCPVSELMPERPADGNKGAFGKVLLLAGSGGMAGACLLAAGAALRSGTGMVKIMTSESNRIIVQERLPEAMYSCNDPMLLKECAQWAGVIAAGPGLSTEEPARALMRTLLLHTKNPLILDADAINILSEDQELKNKLIALQNDPETRRSLILTPHPGELARLAECSIQKVTAQPVKIAAQWAEKLNAVVLCKGARTIAASCDGRVYANSSGNSGMATAGSGDVLTGIVAALNAQEPDPFAAACIGVYLHGLAGDRAAHLKSEYCMKAGDLIEMLPQLLTLN